MMLLGVVSGGGGGGGSSSSEWSKWGGGGGRFSMEERGVVELLPKGGLLPIMAGTCSFDKTEEERRVGGAGFIAEWC